MPVRTTLTPPLLTCILTLTHKKPILELLRENFMSASLEPHACRNVLSLSLNRLRLEQRSSICAIHF